MNLADLLVTLKGEHSGLTQAFTAVGTQATALGGRFGGLQAAVTSFGIKAAATLGVLSIPAAAFSTVLRFDEVMDDVRVATGATGEALAGLSQSFRTVLGNVASGAEEVGKAIGELNTRMGLTGKPLEEMTKLFVDMARIHKTGVGPLIRESTRLFKAWQVSTEDQAKTLDYFHKVSQATAVPVAQLIGTLAEMGPILRAGGMSLERAAAVMGRFEKEGVSAGRGLFALNMALRKLTAEGAKDPQKALADLIKQIRETEDASKAQALAFKYFSRGALFLTDAIRKGVLDTDDFVASMKASHETINEAVKATMSFSDKLVLLRNRLMAAIEPLGIGFVKALEKIIDASDPVIKALTRMTKAFESLPGEIYLAGLGLTTFVSMVMGARTVIELLAKAYLTVAAAVQGFAAALTALAVAGTVETIATEATVAAKAVGFVSESTFVAGEAVAAAAPKFAKLAAAAGLLKAALAGLVSLLTGFPALVAGLAVGAYLIGRSFLNIKTALEGVSEANRAVEVLATITRGAGINIKDLDQKWRKHLITAEQYEDELVKRLDPAVVSLYVNWKRAVEALGPLTDEQFRAAGATREFEEAVNNLQGRVAAVTPGVKTLSVSIMDLSEAFETLEIKSIKVLREGLEKAKEALKSVADAMRQGEAAASDYQQAQAKVYILQDELNKQLAGYAQRLDVAARGYDAMLRRYLAGTATIDHLGRAHRELWEAQRAADPRVGFAAWEEATTRYEEAAKAVGQLVFELELLGETEPKRLLEWWLAIEKVPLATIQSYLEVLKTAIERGNELAVSTRELGRTFNAALQAMREKAKAPIEIDVEAARREYNALLFLYSQGLATIGELLAAGVKLAAMTPPAWLTALITQLEKARTAFTTLGIQSTAELEAMAQNARKAYDGIARDAQSSARDITLAWIAAERTQLKATLARGKLTKEEYKDIARRAKELIQVEEELARQTEIVTKTVETGWQRAGHQVSTVMTDLSRGLAELILEGGKFKDVMVSALEEIAKALLRTAIEAQLKRITDLFRGLGTAGGVLGKIGRVIFGGAAGGGGGAVTAAAAGAAPAAGGVGGAAAGFAGQAAAGWIGAIGSAVSAVTGVIGAFQMKAMNKTLDLIEHQVRYSQIHLLNLLNNANQFWPAAKDIWWYMWNAQLPMLHVLDDKLFVIADKMGAGRGGTSMTINVYESQDARATAKAVADELRRLGIVPG